MTWIKSMSRNLAAAVTSISQLENVKFRLLCEVYSGATPVYACTGVNFIVFNSTTYSPVGNLGGIDPIQEETDVFPRSAKLWFAAVNTQTIPDVINETMFNRPVVVLRTFLTDSFTCVSTPEVVFKGKINKCEMKLKDPERGDFFEIEVDSKLARSLKSLYFNSETLKTVYNQNSNTLFDYVPNIPFVKANWGGMSVTNGGFAPPGPARNPLDDFNPGFGGSPAG